MRTPPDGLPEDRIAAVLARHWALSVASVCYQPVGFGSHHWAAVDVGGTRWFVTVDELETKRHVRAEPLDATFDRLRSALAAVADLRDHGLTFAVAPVPTRDGAPLARLDDRFGVALYPFVDGQSFSWGEFSAPGHRRAVLDLVVAVHSVPSPVGRQAAADDYTIPHRDELAASLDPGDRFGDHGPYARPTAELVAANAAAIRRQLARYDELVAASRAGPARTVLTHGEPHPGNTMLTPDGWRLLDWDTALLAPPERDLWSLDPGDGSVLAAYAEATGVTPRPAVLELYRLRWDLADLAVGVSRFRRPHGGSADDDLSWVIVKSRLDAFRA